MVLSSPSAFLMVCLERSHKLFSDLRVSPPSPHQTLKKKRLLNNRSFCMSSLSNLPEAASPFGEIAMPGPFCGRSGSRARKNQVYNPGEESS